MTVPPAGFATSVRAAAATAEAWTQEAGRLLGRDEPDVAFGTFRAVLHGLRRRLDPDRARALSDALPTLLRGVFHEPVDGAGRVDTRADFLASVDRSTRHTVRPEEAVRAVCAVLASRIPHETWQSVQDGLPSEITSLLAVPPHPDRSRRLVR